MVSNKQNTTANDEELEVVDLGQEPAERTTVTPASLHSLEEKYREQMSQIIPVKIDLPMLTLKTQIDEQINLRPDFQRRDRWTNESRSRYIESIVMNVPVPPVFLGEEEYGKYVVLDGRQRLTAAYMFLSNQLRLEGLKVWNELNGLTYEEIKKKGFAATIERRFLPAILLTKESSPEVKYEVFDRLNTGGVIAEPMEVRNAVFRGKFNEALHSFSEDSNFRRLWGIPAGNDPVALEKNALYRRMDDLELVLRFFALRAATLQGRRFKDHLSIFMQERNAAYETELSLQEEDNKLFRGAVANCFHVFGDTAFRKADDSRSSGLGNRSAPYADAVMHSLAGYETKQFSADCISAIKIAFEQLLQDAEFRSSISTGTNGESAIRIRIQNAKEAVNRIMQNGRGTKRSSKKSGRS
jgi:Protein of unknown function DUF262